MSLACGSAAGLISSTATFPLDLVRRRLQLRGQGGAGSGTGPHPTFVSTFRTVVQVGGCLFCRQPPVIGSNLLQAATCGRQNLWGAACPAPLQPWLLRCPARPHRPQHACRWLPAPAALRIHRCPLACVPPLSSTCSAPPPALPLQREGFRGLYAGILPEYYKVLPGVAIAFMTYELMKAGLGVQTNATGR